jgi:hypothetical protein
LDLLSLFVLWDLCNQWHLCDLLHPFVQLGLFDPLDLYILLRPLRPFDLWDRFFLLIPCDPLDLSSP